MLFGLISIAILVLLGMLNASAFVSSKHPKLKEVVEKTQPLENYIGVTGIILGILAVFSSLANFHGIYGIVGLFTGLLMLALGMLSATTFLKEQIFKNNAALQAKVDECTTKLAVYQQNMGLTGIVLGIVYLLMTLGAY